MVLDDVQDDRAGLKQGKVVLLVGRDQAERMKAQESAEWQTAERAVTGAFPLWERAPPLIARQRVAVVFAGRQWLGSPD